VSGRELLDRIEREAARCDEDASRHFRAAERDGPGAGARRDEGVEARTSAAFLRDLADGLDRIEPELLDEVARRVRL
jgi:hypothetical protein